MALSPIVLPAATFLRRDSPVGKSDICSDEDKKQVFQSKNTCPPMFARSSEVLFEYLVVFALLDCFFTRAVKSAKTTVTFFSVA